MPNVPADGPVESALDVDELVQTYYLEQAGPNTIFAAPAKWTSARQVPSGSPRSVGGASDPATASGE